MVRAAMAGAASHLFTFLCIICIAWCGISSRPASLTTLMPLLISMHLVFDCPRAWSAVASQRAVHQSHTGLYPIACSQAWVYGSDGCGEIVLGPRMLAGVAGHNFVAR